MNENHSDVWTAADFHAWLIEEAFHFRKSTEGMQYEDAEETKNSAEWGDLFREWLADRI